MGFLSNRLLTVLFGAGLAVAVWTGRDAIAQDNNSAGELRDLHSLRKKDNLSPEKQAEKADQILVRIEKHYDQIVILREKARKDSDVVRLECLNDNLVLLKKTLELAERNRRSLNEAMAADDDLGVDHYSEEIKLNGEGADGIRNEATTCVGDDIFGDESQNVTVEGPDGIDVDDPYDGVKVPGTERPAYDSPF